MFNISKKTMAIVGVLFTFPFLMANEGGCEDKGNVSMREQANQTYNQERLYQNQPPPQITVSAERKNLIERLKRLNTENMTGCVDLVSNGTIVARYTVRGKVSSLNSYLTGREKIVDDPYGSMDAGGKEVESPDYDGAYGENAHGVFFFTADTNSYVEWVGDYLYTDQCLTASTKPLLVREVK